MLYSFYLQSQTTVEVSFLVLAVTVIAPLLRVDKSLVEATVLKDEVHVHRDMIIQCHICA